jgi:hypothetical protein
LTNEAAAYRTKRPERSNSSILVADFGGIKNRDLVWTHGSIEQVRVIMLAAYLVTILGIATSIFCLIENAGTKPVTNIHHD